MNNDGFEAITQKDINTYVDSLQRMGTPWAIECARLILQLWHTLHSMKSAISGSSWQLHAYAKLGVIRGSMPPEHVVIVQDFIGPA